MKDFDSIKIRAARTSEEVDNYFWHRQGIACRLVARRRYVEKVKAVYNKVMGRKESL